MADIGDVEAVQILDEAVQTLEFVRKKGKLPLVEWEAVDDAVKRMGEALDRADLGGVRSAREHIDLRFFRHGARSELKPPDESVPMPPPMRTSSDNLTGRIRLVRQRIPHDTGELQR
ncbi:hypothetical protein O3597_06760 [Verrucosispora sp. WMMA2044]|uniref:CATRA-Associated Small Protein domain-containing protein n=1 Tax=Verrucosispora sioxanthis TaxID=2499994 RepID=A0A6M1L7V4_9ACTN|nr:MULTISPECIES: CATRA system-associated protein [Micromonospora]NEE65220.1 hypothetical protein [Verrucosispora sioxanthis]NGM14330.1 hypothetical protein [Verrucosispora sioxanthis]WBB50158.1 hypothetical protein O3597_06760 [Verrucosispora sp. WMMA2044]